MPVFRNLPSHPDDFGKTVVRVGRNQMKLLGISSGDTVRVTGTRSTVAACLPSDDGPPSNDQEFEFLDDSSHRFPLARLSNVVWRNAFGNNRLPLVEIVKTVAAEARVITLSPRQARTYKKKILKLQDLVGTILTTGDCTRIGYKASEPSFLDFLVAGSVPSGCPVFITEATEIDFVPFHAALPHPSSLSRLRRTIQIKKQVSGRRLNITLESMDVYSEGFRCFLVAGYLFDDQMEWLGNRISLMASAVDNLGNSYTCVETRRGVSTWSAEGAQHSRFSVAMIPAIRKEVTRLTLVISEITWNIRERRDMQFLDRIEHVIKHEPAVISLWNRQKRFYMVSTGPWYVDIDLSQNN